MTRNPNDTTGRTGQENINPTIARLGTRLDRADAANRAAFEAWENAHDTFESYATCADLFAQVETTREAVRDAERAYRAAVRGRVVTRGHKDNRRIGDWCKLSVAESDARARFTGDMDECGRPTPMAETKRELIDAHAKLEGVMIDWDLYRSRNRAAGRDARMLRALGM
jgi:hypothetical protein